MGPLFYGWIYLRMPPRITARTVLDLWNFEAVRENNLRLLRFESFLRLRMVFAPSAMGLSREVFWAD